MVSKKTSKAKFTVPGLTLKNGHKIAAVLQARLHALNDLQLTLKHAHWNVVGRDFIGVHEMLDPQIDLVRAMVDETAERIATLGVSPNGLPGALVQARDWNDYSIARAATTEHLAALDLVYEGIISSHRDAITATGELDPITEDILIGQCGKLELFQWFLRAHLESNTGELVHANAATEKAAAKSAKQ
ncbi:Dps family protein [Arthrobacter glacialis]|uniref:DNA starvation/stationary phase protection protein n=1 Tax=Arthrobacter glacialis TaxID=1664 RepID=A0A2S3ZU64_ARTGL|nr:DNA starvation/stationary phase protection protein [Arthrobacter glacialis]POH57834.1 DNA starvation/stationary phase protection protein [Arthrobacter glacialis]POH72634.1 DNA starvation/stationary phase protection protein [Arthrobacter glacialis]